MTSVPPPSAYSEENYDYLSNLTELTEEPDNLNKPSPLCIDQAWCVILVVINVIIFLLGILGNGVVMWIIGFKMKKKTVTTMWYLSLAISDFIYCATLPFHITLTATGGSWIFGRFMCKFTSFVLVLNMFSSIFLMVLISVDRCVAVIHAVWAQNNRTLKRAGVAVVVAWGFSMLMSIPAVVIRDTSVSKITSDNKEVFQCYNNFEILPSSEILMPVIRFVLGFVLPLVIITVCYTIIIVRLRNKKMTRSTKPFKVMTALIVTFVISWLPFHIFNLLDIYSSISNNITQVVSITSATLASANSCMNPFLYAFMGKDIKQKLRNSFLSIFENAFIEDTPSGSKITSTSQALSIQ